MANKKALLNLKVIGLEKSQIKAIFVEKKKIEIKKELSIEINFNEYESEICVKIVNFEIDIGRKRVLHNFEVIEGINFGILFTNFGKTRDLIFYDNLNLNIEVEDSNSHIEKTEAQKILNTKRIILINYSPFYDLLNINGQNFSDEIYYISYENSIQISVINIDKKIMPFKIIIPVNQNEFLEKYGKYEKELNDLIAKFDKDYYTINDDNSINILKSEIAKIDSLSDILIFILNLPKNILLNNYNDYKYFDFISNCCLLKILEKFLLLYKEELKELKTIYIFFKDYKDKLKNNSDLNYYHKILIIIEFTNFFIDKNLNIKEFCDINFQYHEINKMGKQSPGYLSINFIKNFIETLDESSPFYYPLIIIDARNLIYDNKYLYGYGLISKDILKFYLSNIIPEILITFNDNNNNNISNGNIFNSKRINLSNTLYHLDKINISDNINNKDILIDYSLKLIFILFHEFYIHKITGFILSVSEENNNSPNKKGKNILKIEKDLYFEGNLWHILEFFFGQCKYGIIFHLINKMIRKQINLNLLYDNSLWGIKLNILRKYIELKYLIFHEKKELIDDDVVFGGVEEEIDNFEKIIINNKIEFKYTSKKRERDYNEFVGINTIKKKKKKLSKISEESESEYEEEIDYEYYWKRPYNELKLLAEDKNTPFKVVAFLHRILRKKLRKP